MTHAPLRTVLLAATSAVLVAACVKPPDDPPHAARAEPAEIEVAIPAGENQIVQLADSIEWGPCPPVLPDDCEMAVLEGSPKEEILFTTRFRTKSPFELKPHFHPRNERVTILDGKVGVGFGDTIDRDSVTWFGPSDYYVNARGAHHFVLTDGPAIIQITGIGPWKVSFIDAE